MERFHPEIRHGSRRERRRKGSGEGGGIIAVPLNRDSDVTSSAETNSFDRPRDRVHRSAASKPIVKGSLMGGEFASTFLVRIDRSFFPIEKKVRDERKDEINKV